MDSLLSDVSLADDDEAVEFYLPGLIVDDIVPRPVTPLRTLQQTIFLETAEDSVSLILRLYNEGIPLFSKTIFRDIVEQLDRCLEDANSEQKVSIMGLDGTLVHFFFETGQDVSKGSKLFWPGCNIVTAKPRLDYHGLYQLMSPDGSQPGSLERAYLPIEIVQKTELRDVETGELVVPWPMLNHDDVRERFARERAFWEDSVPVSHLRWLLDSTGMKHSIKNIELHQRSTSQHAMLLEVRDLVKQSVGIEVKCFAQDPAYTAIDKQVLGEVGITVLDDPRAWLRVDDGSMVIAIAPTIPVLEIVADIARPVVIMRSAPQDE
ncbi:uncharacterized protein B0H64DRAFT_414613 [Chaetomium fimeti]|uniref:SRR1-like domain-containing protein n=1 Tax=Chaetomium fimeti TaxID=1854472 RepID=A0AAE0HR21_9PEZI|nr:hypothetical protein B0H64DRAFT_414613 [Chaetomium fimeti]